MSLAPTSTTPMTGASIRLSSSALRSQASMARAAGPGDHEHHVGGTNQLAGVVGDEQRRSVDDDEVEQWTGAAHELDGRAEQRCRVVDGRTAGEQLHALDRGRQVERAQRQRVARREHLAQGLVRC